jgi:hypothetical protein
MNNDNINTNIKKIEGVEDCYYNFHSFSLAVYYYRNADLDYIKIKVAAYIGDSMLCDSVQTVNFYSI